MRAAAVFASERAHRDQSRHVEEVPQIQIFLPLEVIAFQRLHGDAVEPFTQGIQLLDCCPELKSAANQSDVFPHQRLHLGLQIDDSFASPFAAVSIEKSQSVSGNFLKLSLGHSAQWGQKHRNEITGNASEDRGLGDAISTEPVGAVDSAGILARDEQSLECRA